MQLHVNGNKLHVPWEIKQWLFFFISKPKKKIVLTDQETAVSSNIYGDNWHLVV